MVNILSATRTIQERIKLIFTPQQSNKSEMKQGI
jgi:hypothetical protein